MKRVTPLFRNFRQALRYCLLLACVAVPLAAQAEVALYDYTQPIQDGVILVGMECNHKNQVLEVGIYEAAYPPLKRMDLWKTADLVQYDAWTNMVSAVGKVERNCRLGEQRYRIRFEGLPGAANAMWPCGAIITARVKVWKDDRLIYQQDLARCGADDSVRLARFSPSSDVPVFVATTP